jgi:eukaryotic-like serine/threonine-protein kinase
MNSPIEKSAPPTTPASTVPAGVADTGVEFDPVSRGHLGEFEIIGKLGEGALSQVFLARQASLGRRVALKLTRGGGTADEAEGLLLAGLEHDHIVKVFSAFFDAATGSRGLCLQYVPGADLGTLIRQVHAPGRVPESGRALLDALDARRRGEAGFDPAALRDREALAGDDFAQAVCRVGGRLAEALAFAHARGVLHCDIKPANILVTQYGRPMLADFNVAFDRTRRPASETGVGGTLPYMAPEHRAAAEGVPGARVDERSDVYSLGVVLFELATGRRPREVPGALDRVPRELAAVVRRCLEPDPAARYQTAAELAAALSGAWHLLAARRALPAPGRIGRWVSEHPVRALALAAVLPHLAASVVNIAYNAVEVQLDPAQARVFAALVVGYNLFAYPLCFGTGCVLFWRIARGMRELSQARGPAVDDLRRRVRQIGWWAIGLGAIGWLPGALVFPLVIDLAAGPVGWQTYAHYAVSFTLAGLIGVVFSYLAMEYVAFRALLPRLGNPDGHAPGKMWAELRPLTAPFGPFLLLACAVPLVGAVLLIAFADGVMTLGFRLLVAGLIGVGVAGVGVAERVTRELRALAAVWQRDAATGGEGSR